MRRPAPVKRLRVQLKPALQPMIWLKLATMADRGPAIMTAGLATISIASMGIAITWRPSGTATQALPP